MPQEKLCDEELLAVKLASNDNINSKILLIEQENIQIKIDIEDAQRRLQMNDRNNWHSESTW